MKDKNKATSIFEMVKKLFCILLLIIYFDHGMWVVVLLGGVP